MDKRKKEVKFCKDERQDVSLLSAGVKQGKPVLTRVALRVMSLSMGWYK